MFKRILSFDTGHNIGWSIIDLDDEKQTIRLVDYGCIKIPSNQTIEKFCALTSYKIKFLELPYINKCRIEIPVFEQSKRGIIAAKTGDLLEIHASAITIYNEMSKYHDTKLLTPNQWKGTMSKKATLKRVEMVFEKYEIRPLHPNFAKMPDHVVDSIGIGITHNPKMWSLTA